MSRSISGPLKWLVKYHFLICTLLLMVVTFGTVIGTFLGLQGKQQL